MTDFSKGWARSSKTWNSKAKAVFLDLKGALCIRPALQAPLPDRLSIYSSHRASQMGLNAVLSQETPEGGHPVRFSELEIVGRRTKAHRY